MSGQPLSAKNAAKIKKFFKDNKSFNDYMLENFDGEDTPACLKNLNEGQKRKLISITIDNLDF